MHITYSIDKIHAAIMYLKQNGLTTSQFNKHNCYQCIWIWLLQITNPKKTEHQKVILGRKVTSTHGHILDHNWADTTLKVLKN